MLPGVRPNGCAPIRLFGPSPVWTASYECGKRRGTRWYLVRLYARCHLAPRKWGGRRRADVLSGSRTRKWAKGNVLALEESAGSGIQKGYEEHSCSRGSVGR